MYPGLEQRLPDALRDPTVDLPFGQHGLQDQKAIEYWTRAGKLSAARSALVEAATQFERRRHG
jgi:hypothetical protein